MLLNGIWGAIAPSPGLAQGLHSSLPGLMQPRREKVRLPPPPVPFSKIPRGRLFPNLRVVRCCSVLALRCLLPLLTGRRLGPAQPLRFRRGRMGGISGMATLSIEHLCASRYKESHQGGTRSLRLRRVGAPPPGFRGGQENSGIAWSADPVAVRLFVRGGGLERLLRAELVLIWCTRSWVGPSDPEGYPWPRHYK